jgi:DNA replication initiation complex subunit (GINS family)
MAEEGIITYEKLYELLRTEKYKKELQKLDVGIYSKIVNYIEEKRSILNSQENKDSIFASQSVSKTKRQIENTKLILKELYERRETKIIQMALFNARTGERLQETDSLLDEEMKFYNNLIDIFKHYKKGILDNILSGQLPNVEFNIGITNDKKEEKFNKMVRFLQPVPKFIGEDMQIYGPFEPEDIANLPERVSEILIKNNRAESI